ncbi:MAG: hypothetical protein N3A60_05265 [Thermanaerothrix sp.]|nr:hypothetical protein [Thermanaerothrix sp.]
MVSVGNKIVLSHCGFVIGFVVYLVGQMIARQRMLILIGVLGATVLVGCFSLSYPQATSSPLPEAATATAALMVKLTAIAVATAYPAPSQPLDLYPAADETWTPGANEIVSGDSGKTYDIWITSRISIVLDRAEYPPEDLRLICEPEGVLGYVSNLPQVPSKYYAVRYEGVRLGQCFIRNGAFWVTIKVVAHP